jgi:hypothetical protein
VLLPVCRSALSFEKLLALNWENQSPQAVIPIGIQRRSGPFVPRRRDRSLSQTSSAEVHDFCVLPSVSTLVRNLEYCES